MAQESESRRAKREAVKSALPWEKIFLDVERELVADSLLVAEEQATLIRTSIRVNERNMLLFAYLG